MMLLVYTGRSIGLHTIYASIFLKEYGEYSIEDITILASVFPEQKKVLKTFSKNEKNKLRVEY